MPVTEEKKNKRKNKTDSLYTDTPITVTIYMSCN